MTSSRPSRSRKTPTVESAPASLEPSPATKPRQAVEVDSFARHLLIRASAGSGKTFQLSSRYIARLRKSAPDRILATTFTRKAAGEILERILLRLARAGLHEEGLAALAPFLGKPTLKAGEALRLLRDMTHHLHRMRVGTLDSFFSKLAASFTLELGFPPGWRMLDDVEDARLRTQAIEAMLREEQTHDIVLLMNRLSKGDVVRSVQTLIADAIDNHYQTFLRTAADAWSPFPLAHHLPQEELESVLLSLEAVNVENASHLKARNDDLERARDGDWEGFLTTGLAGKLAAGETSFRNKPIPEGLIELYVPLLRHARAEMIVPWAHQTAATRDLLERFHVAYEALKRETRGYRFDDIARRLGEHLSGRSAESLAYRLDAGIDHLLLDEFQDTAPVQWDVLRPFARSVVTGEEMSFFCVGDTKQAIYGWRGGLSEIFDAIEQELPGVRPDSLDKSHRSAPLIIDTVNKVFAGIVRHSKLDGYETAVSRFSTAFPVHQTAKDELAGHVRVECPPATSEDGEVSDDDVLEFAAGRVADLSRECPTASIGVLVRTNATVGRMVYKLQRMDVEASEEGGSPLTDSAAVQLVLSLLKLADHPGNTIARFHVAHSPLGTILNFADHRDDAAAERVATDIRARLVQEGYSRTLYNLALKLMPTCGPRDGRRLRQLVDQAAVFEAQASLRPMDFVNYVQTQKVQDPTAVRVRVMNVHQAKGLEFDIVVLPELDKKLRPVTPSHVYRVPAATAPPDCVMIYRSEAHVATLPEPLQAVFREAETREITEALCILYVMLTRAIHALHIIVKPCPREKNPPKTFAGLVRAALTDGSAPLAGQLLHEAGDPRWYVPPPVGRNPEGSAIAGPVAEPDSNIPFAPMTGGRLRGLPRVTPSRAKEQQEHVRLRGILSRETSRSLDRGTLYHAWFERVRWLEEGLPTDETLRDIARRLSAEPEDRERAPALFHAALRPPVVRAALSRATYAELRDLPFRDDVLRELRSGPVTVDVATERRLAVIDEGELIAGTIDRLVLLRQNGRVTAAEILDYKTDARDNDDDAIRDKVDAYRGQLHLYRRAIARMYAIDESRIAMRLVFLLAGRVECIRDEWLKAEG